MQFKNILVTGADGFIGSHLVEMLHKETQQCESIFYNAHIKALSQYNSFNYWGWLEDIECLHDIEVVCGDIRDSSFCKHLLKDIDIVFHLVALIAIPFSYIAPQSYIETNIQGTLNIIQVALECGTHKIIHTSTSEVYGTAQYVPIDEKHLISNYSR